MCIVHQRFAREFSVPERGIELEDLWDESIEVMLGEATAHALAPTDELVSVCVVGARMSAAPSVLWVADAMAVLTAEGTVIDWHRLVRQARRLRATLRLRDALLYIRRELDAPVPDDVIQELETTSTRRRERLAHRAAGRRGRLVGTTPQSATRFLQITSARSVPAALATLPTFLREELGLARRAQVPIAIIREVSARIGKKAREEAVSSTAARRSYGRSSIGAQRISRADVTTTTRSGGLPPGGDEARVR
jgi:hypothetical protein